MLSPSRHHTCKRRSCTRIHARSPAETETFAREQAPCRAPFNIKKMVPRNILRFQENSSGCEIAQKRGPVCQPAVMRSRKSTLHSPRFLLRPSACRTDRRGASTSPSASGESTWAKKGGREIPTAGSRGFIFSWSEPETPFCIAQPTIGSLRAQRGQHAIDCWRVRRG